MSKVKDPQITLVGWIKDLDGGREMVVVALPPTVQACRDSLDQTQSTLKLVERTLLVNLPTDDHIGNTVKCYLKHRVFDERVAAETGNENRNRGNDPQTTIMGYMKTVEATGHELIVVDLPAEDQKETTLIVNVPGEDHKAPEVFCYLKYKMAGERPRHHRSEQGQVSTTTTA